jgi:hypothetical protein
MAKPRQLFYWDSDVLLAHLSKEPTRLPALQTIVADIEGSDDKKKIVTSEIAKQARAFIRQSIEMGVKTLKPYDAIHLATAEWAGVYEFHTYNLDDFGRVQPLVEFKICEPYAAQPRLIGDDSGYQ